MTGFIAEILVPEGETVDVGTKLAVISRTRRAATPTRRRRRCPGRRRRAAAADRSPSRPPPSRRPRNEQPEPTADAPAATGAPSATATGPRAASGPPAVPAAREVPAAEADPPATTAAECARQRLRSGSVAAADEQGAVAGGAPADRRARPRPAQINGTGAGGRITRDDVLALIDANGDRPRPAGRPRPNRQPQPQPQPASTSAPATGDRPGRRRPTPSTAGEDDTVIPFTNIRRRTAEHMVRSKHTSAHTVVAVEVDYAAVERVRQAEKERFKAAEGSASPTSPSSPGR